MVKLFNKAIRINKASQDKNSNEVGANLFIGNLDPEVDEKVRCEMVYSASSQTGTFPRVCLLSSAGASYAWGLVMTENAI